VITDQSARRSFGAVVALLFLGLAHGALVADRRLPGIRSET
jgi:hypothetical protein